MNQSILKHLSWALFCAFLVNANAEEQKPANLPGESTAKIGDVKEKNKVDGNIDEEITNARMRAESGSKSKFSLSSSIGYTGGNLSKPLGELRPNLSKAPGIQTNSSADIGLSARYRWTKNDSMTLGISAGLMTPLQGDTNPKNNQLNVFDPSLSYNRVGKVGPLQTNAAIAGYLGTSHDSRDIRYEEEVAFSYNALYTFQSGLTLGAKVATGYKFYGNDPGEKTDGDTYKKNYYGGDKRSQWTAAVYPFAEFKFNDTFSARTVFGYFNWKHLYGDSQRYRLLQTYVYQSVGVGISITRDVYLYPNIQFVPDNIRSDFTNVALSATINMF